MTVLQLVPEMNVGGVERGAMEIARAIAAAGGRALVASSGGRLEGRLEATGAHHVRLPLASKSPLTIWLNAGRIAALCRREGVDLIHARSRAPAWSGWLAARRLGLPFVTTYHGAYSQRSRVKALYNSVMAKGRPTIAVSEYIADIVRSRDGLREEDLRVIPRGADTSVFAEEMVSATRTVDAARRWGLSDAPRPVVLLPGRLTRWKGHAHFIDAAALLKARRGPDFLCAIVGDDGGSGYEAELAAQIDKAGVGDVVRLLGGTDDMAAAYKLAAIVVSASTRPEAFGRVAVEAQAMGRPVIASAHGGALETVVDGVSGWLYPPGDAAALTDRIDHALNMDESARAHLGLAARARAHALYSVAQMQASTIRVYRDALEQRDEAARAAAP